MFVKSFMKSEAVYRKSTGDTVLKPMTTTFVDEKIVSAKELKACYGDRISIIPSDKEEEFIKETISATEVEVSEEDVKVVTDFLNDVKNDNIPIPDGVEVDKEQVQDVIDFLEGKTDDLPEGTEIITEKEADAIKEAAEVVDATGATAEVTLTKDGVEKTEGNEVKLAENTKKRSTRRTKKNK